MWREHGRSLDIFLSLRQGAWKSGGSVLERPMEEMFEWPDSAPQAIDEGLPGTPSEAERLAISIKRAVRRETSGGVRELSVEVNPEGVMLKGRCDTFYCKQLAQHAAMAVPGGDRLTNDIEVR